MVMANGKSYEGQWHNNLPHGQIIELNPSGDKYEGEYFEGKRQGQGTLTLSSQKTYVGAFVDNMPHG